MISIRAFANDPRFERILLAAFASAAIALSAFECLSPVASALRGDVPVAGLALIRTSQSAPARYLFIFSPRNRALELVYVSSPDILQNGPLEKISWTVPLEMPERYGSPASPLEVKAWIASWPHDIRFWLRMPKIIHALRRGALPPPARYDAWRLAFEFARIDAGSIRLRWLGDSAKSRALVEQLLGMAPPPPSTNRTVEIWNASGQAGVALEATKVLRFKGVDVLDFRNAPAPAVRTQFLDREGFIDAAARVRRALGCRNSEILTRPEGGEAVGVTVILGQDFEECAELKRKSGQGS